MENFEVEKGYLYHIDVRKDDVQEENNINRIVVNLLISKNNNMNIYDVRMTDNFQLIVVTSKKNDYFERIGKLNYIEEIDLLTFDEAIFEEMEGVQEFLQEQDSNYSYEFIFDK